MHILDLLTSVLQLAAAGAGLYAGTVLALRARRGRDDPPDPAQSPGTHGQAAADRAGKPPEREADLL